MNVLYGPQEEFIIVLMGFLTLTSLLRLFALNIQFRHFTAPFSVLTLMLGIFIGLGHLVIPSMKVINDKVKEMNHDSFMHYYIILLIYMTIFALDWPIFTKNIYQILLLGVVSKILTWAITSYCLVYILQIEEDKSHCLLTIGTIFTATFAGDHFEKLKNLRQIGVVLQGEGLFSTVLATTLLITFKQNDSKYENLKALYTAPFTTLGCVLLGITFVKMQQIFKFDKMSYLIIFMSLGYMIVYVCFATPLIAAGSVVSIMGFILVVANARESLEEELNETVIVFTNLLYISADSVLCLYLGIAIVNCSTDFLTFRTLANCVIILTMGFFLRALLLLCTYPLLKRTGYGLDWRRALLLYFGSTLSPTNLLYTMEFSPSKNNQNMMLIYTACYVLVTLVLRAIILPWLLVRLHLIQPSLEAKFNQIQKHLAGDMAVTMKLLENDPLYNKADWNQLREIYVSYFPTFFLDDMGTEYKRTDVTKKESGKPSIFSVSENSVTRTIARIKILKALRISLYKQEELGLLSEEARRVLYDEIELAFNKSSLMVTCADIKKYWTFQGFLVRLQFKLLAMLPKKTLSLHQQRISLIETEGASKLCDNMFGEFVKSLWWSWLVIIAITISIANVIEEAVNGNERKTLTFTIAIFFVVQIIAEFMVWGFRKDRIVMSVIDILGAIIIWASIIVNPTDDTRIYYLVLRCITATRYYRIVYIVKRTYPIVINELYHASHQNIRKGYDIAKGLVVGYDEVLKILHQLTPSDIIREICRDDINTEREKLLAELDMMQREWPTITLTLKTWQCSKYFRQHIWKAANKLKESGILNYRGLETLLKKIHSDKYRFASRLKMSIPNDPFEQMLRLPWLSEQTEFIKEVMKKSITKSYTDNDIIVKKENPITHLIILLSGIVRLEYSPDEEILERLTEYGYLPTTDFLKDLNFSSGFEYFIASNQIIGQKGLLTKRNSDVNIICEGSAQVVEIATKLIMEEIEKSNDKYTDSLQYKLGKMIAIQIGELILKISPDYQGHSAPCIRHILHQSLIPHLQEITTLTITENGIVSIILLTEGTVRNDETSEQYIAPCVIPNHLTTLVFDITPPWIILIPSSKVDSLKMEVVEDTLLVGSLLNKCPLHFNSENSADIQTGSFI